MKYLLILIALLTFACDKTEGNNTFMGCTTSADCWSPNQTCVDGICVHTGDAGYDIGVDVQADVGCSQDNDCPEATQYCEADAGRCTVGCRTANTGNLNSLCSNNLVCKYTNRKCEKCTSDSDCPVFTHCSTSSGQCLEKCFSASHCQQAWQVCTSEVCTGKTCTTNGECGGKFCKTASQVCVECLVDGDCASNQKCESNRCKGNVAQCGACTADSECKEQLKDLCVAPTDTGEQVCGTYCLSDATCTKGYTCKYYDRFGVAVGNCVPARSSCEALEKINETCTSTTDCGDLGGCYITEGGQSICTYQCLYDSHCPSGYECGINDTHYYSICVPE